MTQQGTLSDNALEQMIFHTLNFDAGRGGHTVETLVRLLFESQYVPDWRVRTAVAALIGNGHLDMRSDGVLLFPEESEEREVELFRSSWFSVVTGRHIGGPFSSWEEAQLDLSKF